jgi:hypothetical protein
VVAAGAGAHDAEVAPSPASNSDVGHNLRPQPRTSKRMFGIPEVKGNDRDLIPAHREYRMRSNMESSTARSPPQKLAGTEPGDDVYRGGHPRCETAELGLPHVGREPV